MHLQLTQRGRGIRAAQPTDKSGLTTNQNPHPRSTQHPAQPFDQFWEKHRPLARATVKSQNLMETTPIVTLTRGWVYKGRSRTRFQQLRKPHLLLL